MSTLRDAVEEYFSTHTEGSTDELVGLLEQREDQMVERLHMIGVQFGLHAEIIAQVLTNEVPMGTPAPEEVKKYVHDRFVAHIEEIRRQSEGGTT